MVAFTERLMQENLKSELSLKQEGDGGCAVARWVKCLPSKCEDQTSDPLKVGLP